MNNLSRFPTSYRPGARRPLLTPADLQEQLGISLDNAKRIIRVYGVRMGHRLYITEAQLDEALKQGRIIK